MHRHAKCLTGVDEPCARTGQSRRTRHRYAGIDQGIEMIGNKAPDLLTRAGLSRAASRLVASHGYEGLTKSTEPEIDLNRIAALLADHRRELQTKGFSK